MSLLNDALRKKKKEINRPQASPLVSAMPESTESISKKKGYSVFIIFVSFFTLILGAWIFFSGPSPSPNDVRLTKSVKEEQHLKKHSTDEAAPVINNNTPKAGIQAPALEKAVPVPKKAQNLTSVKIVQNKISRPEPDPLIKNVMASSEMAIQKKKSLSKKSDIKRRIETPQKNVSPSKLTPEDTMFYKRAVSYHKSGHLEKSIQMYEQLVNKNPGFDAARFNLAAAYIQESMFSKANFELKNLQQKDPENPEILLNLAITEIGLNNPEGAITFLKLADTIEKQPNFAIFYHLGIANSKIDKFAEALIWYNKAKQIDPHNPNIFFNMGMICERSKEFDKAVDYYEQTLKYGSSFRPEQKHHIETRIQELNRY